MDRIAQVKTGRVDPKVDNMLKVTSDGRKAALDLRLIGQSVDPPDSKVNMAVGRIFEIWAEGKDKRTAQMVFSDLSTPNKERWNVYDEIRRKLTLKGVPAEEIAYAHDADTEAKKKILMDKVNKGEIRVLIGSTGKDGRRHQRAGTADRASPSRCAMAATRRGATRGAASGGRATRIRRFNIIRYVTAPSFDAYMWGLVTRKARFIEQIMTGKTGREAEDIGGDSLGAAEAEAARDGQPAH